MVGEAGSWRVTSADRMIAKVIREQRSFLLDAGAGSGKTFSLVKSLALVRREFRDGLLARHQQVSCITYTNVAKNEIIDRYVTENGLPAELIDPLRDAVGARPVNTDELNGLNYDANIYIRIQIP